VARETATVRIPVPSPAKASAEKELPVPSSDRRSTPTPETPSYEGGGTREYDAPPPPNPWAGATGGPACQSLADCCRQIVRAMSGAGLDPRTCDQMMTFPSVVCAQAIPMMRQEAAKRGARCR
jgi:hypothetical protein